MWQAGTLRSGKNPAAHFVEPRARMGVGRRTVHGIVREAPAGERSGIAVHDADAQAADLGHDVHGKIGETLARIRRGGGAQFAQDWAQAGLTPYQLPVGALSPAHAAISVVDDDGQTVALAQPARRIVSLAPHVTEMLYAAGGGDRIGGLAER